MKFELIFWLLVIALIAYGIWKALPKEMSCEEYCKKQFHVLCFGEWNVSGKYPNCVCNYVCVGSNPTPLTTTTIPNYLAILQNISSSYNWTNGFNCADFTALAVRELRKANYSAYPICGWLRHTYHAWVRIEFNESFYRDFDPQTAKDVTENPDYKFSKRCIVRGVY